MQFNLYHPQAAEVLERSNVANIANLSSEQHEEWSLVAEIIIKASNFFETVNSDENISYEEFSKKLWHFLNSLHSLTKDWDPKILKQQQLLFRGALYHLLNQSLVLSRALTKPFGYPGDFIMLQTLYDNKPISSTKLGRYLDQFFFDDELAKAVVNRVEVMGDRVVEFIKNSKKDELNILNIASGSGFELKKITEQSFGKKVTYHCFDQEVASLCHIAKHFQGKNPDVDIKLYKQDIRTFFRDWQGDNNFDFVYNIGLADYLPDRILGSLVKEALEHLGNNGIFVLAHKDYMTFPHHHPSWLYDWNFIHRNSSQYAELLSSTTGKEFDLWFESPKKIVCFSEFKKQVNISV